MVSPTVECVNCHEVVPIDKMREHDDLCGRGSTSRFAIIEKALTSQSPVDYVDVSIIHIYFVVQFYPWLNFYFGYFFFSMPFITIQKNKGKNLASDRIEPQHVHAVVQFYPDRKSVV